MWLYSKQEWGFGPEDVRHRFKYIKQSSHSKDLYYELADIMFTLNREVVYSFKDRIKHATFIQDRTEDRADEEQLKFLIKAIFMTDKNIRSA
jgi:hypothetical protein